MQTLIADSITKSFGRRELLSGVYLSCQTGRITGLLGRNGCGKSTLLKIIFGTERATFAHVRINDQPVKKAYRSKQLYLLTQRYELPAGLSVKRFLELTCVRFSDRIMAIPFVAARSAQALNTLSGGERRFIQVLAAVYADAPFVLLDEPFSNLSPVFAEEIVEHLRLMKREKGFIVTDHRYAQLISCCDDLVLLHNNSNYVIRHPEELIRHGYLPAGTDLSPFG